MIWSNVFGIGHQLVVVELHEEWNLMRVLARDRPNTPSVRNRVAAALDGEFHDVLGIELTWFGANEAPAECSMP